MFYIEDGRSHFWQWDSNCRLVVEDPSIKEVHFCNRTDSCSLVCEVYFHDDDFGGIYVVNVPNIILQDNLRFRAYAYDGNKTLHEEYFEVKKRSKPSDYVYTETEVKRYEDFEERIAYLEENSGSAEHTHFVAGELTGEVGDLMPIMFMDKSCTTFMVSYSDDTIDVGEACVVTLNYNGALNIAVNSKYTNGIEEVVADGKNAIYGAANPDGVWQGQVEEKIEIKFFGAGSIKFDSFNEMEVAEVGFIDAESMKFVKNHNITNGEGEKSVTQVKDADYWNSVNEQVKDYIKNDKAGANNGAKINGVKVNNNVFVGAFGKLSTMLGGKSQAMGGKSHAEGSKTIALENNSHAEGNETFAAGAHSHAEGNVTSAIGAQSHAEGLLTVAQGECAHAEGEVTTASGISAHSEGTLTTASGDYSHAEGYDTFATGENSHSEGWETEASGYASHVQGGRNLASGAYSFAGGFENTAKYNYQTVIGVAAQQSATENLFIIGNGTLNDDYSVKKRSNAFTVDKDGNATLKGTLKLGLSGEAVGTYNLGKKYGVYKKIAEFTVAKDADGNLPSAIYINTDMNKERFNLEDFYLVGDFGLTEPTGTLQLSVNGSTATSGTAMIGNFKVAGLSNTTTRIWNAKFESDGRARRGGIAYANNQSLTNTASFPSTNCNGCFTQIIPPNLISTIYSVRLAAHVPAENTFIEGSKFELWGVVV